MSFFDFFRNFFSVRHRDKPDTNRITNSDFCFSSCCFYKEISNDYFYQNLRIDDYDSHQENFRNPIWQSDEDDDDDDIANFLKHFEDNSHINIFSNLFEKMFFESQRDMSNNVFTFGSTFSALPFVAPEKDENLRDKMLKSNPDTFEIDTDLDERISAEEFSKMWNKGNIQNQNITKPFLSSSFHFLNRMKIKYGSDGSIEKKQVIRDNKGNEETIISQEIGNKKYVVTTRKDKNGIETKSEDLVNIDESELKDFIQKWKPIKDNIDGHNLFFNFPWKKFIDPNYDPKL